MAASLEIVIRTEVAVRELVECRPGHIAGKAEAPWEETSEGTMGTAGVEAQASREGFAEITSGRTTAQQGLTATCTDPPTEAKAGGGGRGVRTLSRD